jgi:4'-phosphopantetheinyl transferase EntD
MPKPKRETESDLARRAINQLMAEETEVLKNQYGGPYLPQHPTKHLSISHGAGWAGAMISNTPCGFDIEPLLPRLLKIQSRFLSEEEKSHFANDILLLGIAWSAKESIYKWYGKRGLTYATDILLSPPEASTLAFEIKTNGKQQKGSVEYLIKDDAVITWLNMQVDVWDDVL